MDNTNLLIDSLLNKQSIDLEIPKYIDPKVVKEHIGSDDIVLWQSDNEHNYCVVTCHKEDDEDPFHHSYLFSRFFSIGNKTVISNDVYSSNLFEFSIKLAKIANKFYARSGTIRIAVT